MKTKNMSNKDIFVGTNLYNCYKDVVNCFSQGLTPHQISSKFNISYDDVVTCLSKYGKFTTSIFTRLSEDQVNYMLKLSDAGKKTHQIATELKLDRHVAGRLLKRYGRTSQHSNKKFDKVRRMPFSKHHKDIIVGTLLGDGCIHKQRKKSNDMYKYYLSHSKKQEEYFLWKFENLKPFFTKYYEIDTTLKSTGKTYQQLKSTSIAHSEFKMYFDMFYDENGIKFVPKNIDLFLTPFVMALWFMDDGSLTNRDKGRPGSAVRICSLNFSYQDHLILKHAIKACFDINVKIAAYNRNGKKFYYISFNKRNSWLLKDIIGEYILPSMQYKLNLTPR